MSLKAALDKVAADMLEDAKGLEYEAAQVMFKYEQILRTLALTVEESPKKTNLNWINEGLGAVTLAPREPFNLGHEITVPNDLPKSTFDPAADEVGRARAREMRNLHEAANLALAAEMEGPTQVFCDGGPFDGDCAQVPPGAPEGAYFPVGNAVYVKRGGRLVYSEDQTVKFRGVEVLTG